MPGRWWNCGGMRINSDRRTAVFLQARLGSQRLSHKVLRDLNGTSVVEHAMLRLSQVAADEYVLLTDKYSFPMLSTICDNLPNWDCFVGPARDVLARFVFAARHYAVDIVIRATADNPLVSHELAALLLDRFHSNSAEYAAFTLIPYGSGVECVSAKVLERAFSESMSQEDHEHVCPYLYKNPDTFRIFKKPAPPEYRYPDLRITLDTEEDYRFLQRLFRTYQVDSRVSLLSLLNNMYCVGI